MDRGDRRTRTAKIAKKRFRQLYCNYHGTPEAWFFRYDKTERAKLFGMCRDKRYSWRCRCSYCLGKVFLDQSIAEQNHREQLEEAISNNRIESPVPYVQDSSSVGIYDWKHELWDLFVRPWPRSWSMGNRFHHPK